tara:strand:+ start:215 stop:778 length:564 start_codon:yes stop_codon:yes gene_type:complete
MSRDISAGLLAALGTDHIQPFFAVELLFDTAPLRLWTGVGDKVINVQGADQTFTGTGSLLEIGGLDEVNDLSAKSVSLSLTGLNESVLSIALQEPYQRRKCRLYFGEQSVADVVEIFAGKMNTMSINDEAESSTIVLDVESNLIELERSSNWRYTDENHQSRYSGDTFFSYVQTIQDQQVAWGRKSA